MMYILLGFGGGAKARVRSQEIGDGKQAGGTKYTRHFLEHGAQGAEQHYHLSDERGEADGANPFFR
jgi:hypothetical protein